MMFGVWFLHPLALSQKMTLPEIECFDVNPKKYEMVEDMAELTYLNDATVCVHHHQNQQQD